MIKMKRMAQVLFVIICASPMTLGIGIFDLNNGYRLLRNLLDLKAPSQSRVQTRWIEQPLDHFDKNNLHIWPMRYFERLDLWKPGGPIYIFIGGEGEAHPGYLTGGMVYELANETNGALFMSEHRYYGKSMPLNNSGEDNLKYLSSRQALADLSRLIKRLKFIPSFKQSKVVLVGGSYPGNLAAWMKLLYPEQVDAALASSAPVLAKNNFYEYLETVTDVYQEHGGDECYEFIKNKFNHYNTLLQTDDGIETLKNEENVCEQSDLSKEENKHLFVYGKAGYFMSTAQYGNADRIRSHCNRIMNDTMRSKQTRELDSLSFVGDAIFEVKDFSFWSQKEKCWDVDFDGIIAKIRKGGNWLASWVYQMCTEFSYAKSTDSENQIFSNYIPIKTFYKVCVDSFGEDYGKNNILKSVNETNALYGGLTPSVKNVVFVNGEMDPWHRLGILEDLSYDAPAKFVPRSSHCMDLVPHRENDPEEMIETRKYVKYVIKSWIGIEPVDKKQQSLL